jgi:hypothetical protein
MMEKGSALISQILPGLSPAMVDTVEKLRMTVPRALAEMSAAGLEDGMGVGGPNPALRPPAPALPMPLAA